jgi:hypothetical protein
MEIVLTWIVLCKYKQKKMFIKIIPAWTFVRYRPEVIFLFELETYLLKPPELLNKFPNTTYPYVHLH